MKNINKYESPIKVVKRIPTSAFNSPILLLNKKWNYKNRVFNHCNSLQTINESSEISGLTRINSMNRSNPRLPSLLSKKTKGRVTFAPSYRLIKIIDYNPKEIINGDNNNNKNNNKNNYKNENKNKKYDKKYEQNSVCIQCTCILI